MTDNIKRIREIVRALGQTLDKVEEVDDYIDADAEVQRLIKREYKDFVKRKELKLLKVLGDLEQVETGQYVVSYRPTQRRVLNEERLEELVPDADLRDLLYVKKPKTIKEIEEICAENGIKQSELFVKKEGRPSLKIKEK